MDNIDRSNRELTVSGLAQMIDHTRLGVDTTVQEIRVLCEEAAEYEFASVCVPPCYVREAALILNGAPPSVCTVLSFPHGDSCTGAKVKEACLAIENGATEVDMVMAVGLFKSGFYDAVKTDIEQVVQTCEHAALVKVILECILLTDEQKRMACHLARDAGADYVKTSTGYANGGATEQDIALMHSTIGEDLGIKASGGIRTFEEALAMIRAGATRIGASASLAIIQGIENA
ncbi:MAG: deoxyribose-phosphate aldolase [Bacteroidetes bacterium]|nr:deoxyribose-phosphate aldolase [Bacteroidota bacterium]MCY4206301.1 deoxyribose-phosphate aldolase [Bacteroidota bacterium]